MTIKITAEQAITELRNVVKTTGSTYEIHQCTYTKLEDEGNYESAVVPNCIVGQAAFNLGVTIDQLSKFDSLDYSDVYEVNKVFDVFDHNAARVFKRAQIIQDGLVDCSWGRALQAAEEEYRAVTT